jgi:hypothetical protein
MRIGREIRSFVKFWLIFKIYISTRIYEYAPPPPIIDLATALYEAQSLRQDYFLGGGILIICDVTILGVYDDALPVALPWRRHWIEALDAGLKRLR